MTFPASWYIAVTVGFALYLYVEVITGDDDGLIERLAIATVVAVLWPVILAVLATCLIAIGVIWLRKSVSRVSSAKED
jgi:hypothetical protein